MSRRWGSAGSVRGWGGAVSEEAAAWPQPRREKSRSRPTGAAAAWPPPFLCLGSCSAEVGGSTREAGGGRREVAAGRGQDVLPCRGRGPSPSRAGLLVLKPQGLGEKSLLCGEDAQAPVSKDSREADGGFLAWRRGPELRRTPESPGELVPRISTPRPQSSCFEISHVLQGPRCAPAAVLGTTP